MKSTLTLSRLVTAALLTSAASVVAEDWPQWRGPDRTDRSSETGLLDSWPADGPPLVWKSSGLGEGYSSVAVADGRIYTLGDLGDATYAIAMSEKDGKQLWKTKFSDPGGHNKYKGSRSTPTVAGGHVYVLSQHGDLACLTTGGDLKWSRNLDREFGGKMMSGWKYSESPLVDGDKVVCTPGGSQGTVLALNKNTGQKIWQTKDWTDSAGYSSIVIATIHGVRQYVQLTGDSVAGIDPANGNVLWRADRPGKTAVITTPIVDDNFVFVTSAYGVGCNGFRIDKNGSKFSATQVYKNLSSANHHGGVVKVGDYLYGSSGATFNCVNFKTGELAWEERSVGKGSTTYADGHLYLRAENGPVALIKADPKAMVEVSRFSQPERSRDRAWAHPVIANGKLYLRDWDKLLCYNIKK